MQWSKRFGERDLVNKLVMPIKLMANQTKC